MFVSSKEGGDNLSVTDIKQTADFLVWIGLKDFYYYVPLDNLRCAVKNDF